MILVREYIPSSDKVNTQVISLEDAFKLLNKTKYDISQRVKWLNFEDIFFNKTRNYIRITLWEF